MKVTIDVVDKSREGTETIDAFIVAGKSLYRRGVSLQTLISFLERGCEEVDNEKRS